MTIKTFNTEGVLVIANITKCRSYYSEKEFNYDYPEGLFELIIKGIVHIITTKEVVKNLNFAFDKTQIDLNKWKYNECYNYLHVEENDQIRLVSHATFTGMCSQWNQSESATDKDIQMFNFQQKMLKDMKIEKTISLDSIVEARKKRCIESEEKLIENSPKIELEIGFNKLNVYTKIRQQLAILFEKIDTVDFDKITLKPLAI